MKSTQKFVKFDAIGIEQFRANEHKMNAVEYLTEIQRMKEVLDYKREQYQDCIEKATSTTIPVSRVKVKSSASGNGLVEKYVVRAADLEKEIDQAETEFFNHRHEVIQQIQGLRNAHYVQVLYKVYVHFKQPKEVSVETGMSRSYTRKLHKDALAAFEEKYADEIAEWERGRGHESNDGISGF